MTHYNKFLDKAILKFGDKFDYSKFIYINAKTKGIIICSEHGEFLKTPEKHTEKNSHGCNKCYYDYRKTLDNSNYNHNSEISKNKFIKKAKLKFGDKFIYELTNYNEVTGNNISITCPEHGSFEMIPRAHLLSNTGCNKCGDIIRRKSNTNSYEDSIEVVNKIHNNKYTYPIENKEIYINKKVRLK